jgi:cytochrome c oxidase subunit 2
MGRALAILVWLLTLASVALFFSGWWFPTTITEHGPRIDQQFLITIIVVGIAFVAAQVGLGWMLWRYSANARNKEERALYTHGNNRLEVIWTVVTAVVFIGLAVMGQRVWAQLHFSDAPAGSPVVEVVAQQFVWNMHYPGPDGKLGRTDPTLIREDENNFIGLDEKDPGAKDDVTAATLVVSVNRPVELILRSKDVTHSFWVPQLRFKQDLVPGMQIHVHFTPTRVGQFQLACAELCGMNHYKMKGTLLVLPEAQYRDLMALPQSEFQSKVATFATTYDVGAIYDEHGTKIGNSY